MFNEKTKMEKKGSAESHTERKKINKSIQHQTYSENNFFLEVKLTYMTYFDVRGGLMHNAAEMTCEQQQHDNLGERN